MKLNMRRLVEAVTWTQLLNVVNCFTTNKHTRHEISRSFSFPRKLRVRDVKRNAETSTRSAGIDVSKWAKNAAVGMLVGFEILGMGTSLDSTKMAWAFDVPVKIASPSPQSSVDEAWALLKKYYVDPTFHGQDWDRVHDDARREAETVGNFNAIDHMTKSLGDKYTRLLSEPAYTKLSRFDLVGVGALLAPGDDGHLVVASPPMAGSSSLKQGVAKGDVVLFVNGKSTQGMSSFDVIDLVSGDNSPSIELTIKGEGGKGAEKVLTLQRQSAKVTDPVYSRMLPDSSTGYIRLSEFNSRSVGRVKEAVTSLQLQGATRFVLDLR